MSPYLMNDRSMSRNNDVKEDNINERLSELEKIINTQNNLLQEQNKIIQEQKERLEAVEKQM